MIVPPAAVHAEKNADAALLESVHTPPLWAWTEMTDS